MGLKLLLSLAFLLFSFTAASQPIFPPGIIPAPEDGEFEIWMSNRRVLCSTHKSLETFLKEKHGEHRVLTALPVERDGGPNGFLFFASKKTWSAVELIGKRACVISHGTYWEYKPIPGDPL